VDAPALRQAHPEADMTVPYPPLDFLKAVALAVLHADDGAGLPALAAQVWATWGQATDGPARGTAVRALVKLSAEGFRHAVSAVVDEVAAGRDDMVRKALAGYLARIPNAIRQAARRSAAAGAARARMVLARAEDLVPLLPAELPCSSRAGPAVILTVIEGPHQGRAFTLTGHETFLVGRSVRAHLRLPDKDRYFSRVHFLLEVNPPRCRLLDTGSRNGTYINEQRVSEADLLDGDRIKAGHTILRVSIGGGTENQTLAPQQPATAFEPPSLPPPLPPLPPTAAHITVPAGPGVSVCRACPAATAPSDVLCPDCRNRVNAWPQLIPGYELVRELGRGGMGVVYLGLRTTDTAAVAVKTLHPTASASKAEVARFLREASVIRELDHPHIVSFRDIGNADGLLYFVMDYVCGTDAGWLVAEHGPLPIPRAVGLVCQLLQALDYAHAKGFVHRDVKPPNLLVTQEGGRDHAKLADFGLARVYQASRLSGLTMSGEVGGTPAYMPPEQVTNYRDALPATDLYAVGATLYHLLTGRHVYDMPPEPALRLLMILEQDPIPIQRRRPDIPEGLAAVIHRSLAREPADRFPSAQAMRKALLPFVAGR
jgi:serine/threonine-protein kinase